jgi:hypothetical protein
MTADVVPGSSNIRHGLRSAALAAVAALATATLPIVVGAALLVSAFLGRPLLAAPWLALRLRPARPGQPVAAPGRAAFTRATIGSGLVLIAVGAAQGLGALLFGISITTFTGLALRLGFALAAEACLAVIVYRYLRGLDPVVVVR